MPKTSSDSGDGPDQTRDELVDLIGRLASGGIDKKSMRRLAVLLSRYLHFGWTGGRKGIKFNGRGLADLLFAIAPRLPIRDLDALHRSYGGMTGGALAGQVIKGSTRASAAVGGITGALATAGELAPPLWVTLPVEILAETVLVSAIEMRMITELHNVYGTPIEGTQDERANAIIDAWSQGRGVDMDRLAKKGRSELLEANGVKNQLSRVVKRKIMGRAARNVGSLAPLFLGAVIGAETNRRSTRDIGDSVVRDLAGRSKSSEK